MNRVIADLEDDDDVVLESNDSDNEGNSLVLESNNIGANNIGAKQARQKKKQLSRCFSCVTGL